MLSLIRVPPRSLAPAVRRYWAILGPSLTQDDWMFLNVGPNIRRARACILTTSLPVAPGRTPFTSLRRYIGASWWIRLRGTNSVNPPVSFWMSRRRAMCFTQWIGWSTWPDLIHGAGGGP